MAKMRILAAMLAVSVLQSSIHSADAAKPAYAVIQPSPVGHTSGYVVPTSKQSYAWGFFGAKPQSHVYWQHGYYGNYHQRVVIEPFRK